MKRQICLQPKQTRIYRKLTEGKASWIGMGGGRGCGKSQGIDSIFASLMLAFPGVLCFIAMRNFDQVKKYHIDPMRRQFPEWDQHFSVSNSVYQIPLGKQTSVLHFLHAENYEAVERKFRSGNFRFGAIDQAEQFVKEELVEIKK